MRPSEMALSVEKERKGDVMLPSDNHSLPRSLLLVQYYKWLLLIISKIATHGSSRVIPQSIHHGVREKT